VLASALVGASAAQQRLSVAYVDKDGHVASYQWPLKKKQLEILAQRSSIVI